MCCRRDYLSDYTGDYYGFEGRHVLGAVEAMQLHKVNAIFERLASLCLLCNKTSHRGHGIEIALSKQYRHESTIRRRKKR